MTYYFAWLDSENEVFDPTVHCREDEAIFALEISQKEAEFARASITIKNPGQRSWHFTGSRFAIISHNEQLLFRGRLQQMPLIVQDELVRLTLTAEPRDAADKMHTLARQLKQAPYYHPLLQAGQLQLSKSVLNGRSALYNWCRKTGRVSLSSILEGKKTLDLDGNFLRDSLKVSFTQRPLAGVKIQLIAEWMQEYIGTRDISKIISQAFTGGIVNSLTGAHLQKSWWPQGYQLHKDQYWIASSTIQEIAPPITGGLNLYPRQTPPIWSLSQGGRKRRMRRKVSFARSWFHCKASLGFAYRQKRREIAEFILPQALQDSKNVRPVRKLVIKLPNILKPNQYWQPAMSYNIGEEVVHAYHVWSCIQAHTAGDQFDEQYWDMVARRNHIDPQVTRASYFLTDAGQAVLESALHIAQAHLALSSRVVHAIIKAPLTQLYDISLDHNVRLKDPRLPGGTMTGKVIGYRLIVDGAQGVSYGEVKIGACLGQGNQKPSLHEPPALYGERAYSDVGYQAGTPKAVEICRVAIGDIADQLPAQGITYPHLLEAEDLLAAIKVENEGHMQQDLLLNHPAPSITDMGKFLAQHPTDIKVGLKDLQTREYITHTIKVPIHGQWSAPNHLTLVSNI